MKKLLSLAVALAITMSFQSAVAVDATAAWNQYNLQYNFAPYPQSPSTTFEGAYLGNDFGADFAGIKQAVSAVVMGSGSEIGGDDLVNESLENWS